MMDPDHYLGEVLCEKYRLERLPGHGRRLPSSPRDERVPLKPNLSHIQIRG